MQILIRYCVVQDIPEVLAIENLSFADPYPESLFLSFLERFPIGFRIAESDGNLSGYSVILPLQDKNTVVITSLAVHPNFKRNKIATRLLIDAMKIARKFKSPSITLQVAVDNIAAQSLYSKFGFTKTGAIKNYYGRGHDGLEMRISLKGT
ncbi:MAG: GNAT family N-acetyltransferase [Nitrososphaerota archaeon]|nr:GNAT family N-acetyltransferase [Nitrososphaerota archaeon]